MKRFRIAALIFAVLSVASHADETNFTLTVDGVTYSNVTFRTVTLSTVSIFHKTGIATVPLAKLPPDLQQRFGYNPEKAAAERNRALEQQKKREAEMFQQQQIRQDKEQKTTQDYRTANADGSINVIPYVGDETPLQKILAEPFAANGKTFIVCGAVNSANYYNFNYSEAAAIYYSLEFWQLTPDLQRDQRLVVYAPRTFAKPFVDSVTDVQAKGKAGKLARLKIAITPNSFSYGRFNEDAELIDWQILNSDRASWGPWARGAAR